MKGGGSLRLRLLAGTLVWIVLAVALAGWGLRALFLEHITQQLQAQLLLQLDQLSAAVDWSPGTGVTVAPLAFDARLQQPLSGLYWQVDELGDKPRAAVARSRSLWDQALTLPAAPAQYPAAGYRVLWLKDVRGHELLAVARPLDLPEHAAPPLRVVVAGDRQLLTEPLQRFMRLLLAALTMLALGLVVAATLQLHLALRPLKLLHQRLAAVRSGEAAQLAGDFPQELEPLVDEFNHVLRENADMVQRARTQAGNLAHAVHTPLAVLANAADLDRATLAQLVREQVGVARRQVDWHLARARAAAAVRATGLRTPVREPVQALLRTMERLHVARGVRFDLTEQVQDIAFRGEAQDLYELLGNLLDNAGKWARSRVSLDVQRERDQLCFTIDDDGPGIPEAERERMFERGVQGGDERPGSGLGLDIVRTLAETYDGRVQALASPLGGLRMRLWLPAAGAAG